MNQPRVRRARIVLMKRLRRKIAVYRDQMILHHLCQSEAATATSILNNVVLDVYLVFFILVLFHVAAALAILTSATVVIL